MVVETQRLTAKGNEEEEEEAEDLIQIETCSSHFNLIK
jgi:hypothetical protein